MGVRIVVVLNLDLAHLWTADRNLGRRLLAQAQASKHAILDDIEGARVVEVMDDNLQALMMLDGYSATTLCYEPRQAGRGRAASLVALLRIAGRALGFKMYRNYLRPSKPRFD